MEAQGNNGRSQEKTVRGGSTVCLDSATRPKYAFGNFIPSLPEKMTPHVLVSEHAFWVMLMDEGDKLVKRGVEGAEFGRGKGMGFSPVGTTVKGGDDRFEAGKVFSVRRRLSVGPIGSSTTGSSACVCQ